MTQVLKSTEVSLSNCVIFSSATAEFSIKVTTLSPISKSLNRNATPSYACGSPQPLLTPRELPWNRSYVGHRRPN
jgi:hypothetical protein